MDKSKIRLRHDMDVDIASAHSRRSKKWKNRTWRWSELVQRCSEPLRTGESAAEYARMSREEQSLVKDVGGFVGGYLSGGARKGSAVLFRSLVTLDIDDADGTEWDELTMAYNCAAMVYSTHSHTEAHPRLRIVLPASRQISREEYEPVARYWAARMGIDRVDPASFRPAQLMYWPATSRDGVYVFDYQDGPAFDVDEVLRTYRDPMDASAWPVAAREGEIVAREMRRAGDPTEKPGLIGAFCCTYSIEDAIDTFLGDVYEATAQPGRYTYRAGSVAGGLVTYDGKWAYSHHDTDPASRRLCNAFDLVRIHKFGTEDSGRDERDVTKLPSYAMMQDLAAADKRVRALMTRERLGDFDGFDAQESPAPAPGEPEPESLDETDTEWMSQLEYDRKGNIKASPKTLRAIALNDPNFRKVGYDLFSQRDTIRGDGCAFCGTHGDEEVDDTSLARMCAYLADVYGIDMAISSMVDKLLKLTAPERSYHAVRDFITAEAWDGVPRVDTLLVDYLGADDTPLTRAVTRKWMAAAVGRALDTDPADGEGIKFDYCLVLYGEQGTGKSTFAETLAGRWRGAISFADSKKEQYETLQRSWIVEVPEFKGMKSADTDFVKDLISSRSDNFRAAYARQWNKNPRHSVLIGSTNNEHFLKDVSGNRRFWVVLVTGGRGVRRWRDELRAAVGQIWAEAYEIYKNGEPLMLDEAMDREMRAYAEAFNEVNGDPLRDYLAEWLDIKLPVDWATYEPKKRIDYYRYYDPLETRGTVLRDEVGISEIITECPYPGISKYASQRIGGILKSLGWERQEVRRRVDTIDRQTCGQTRKKSRTTFFKRAKI